MTVQISDQQAAEFRLEGLPLRGTMVSGEDEEEDYQLWPAVMLAVMLHSNQLPHMLINRC